MKTALGTIEVYSIPRGIEAGDAMLKAAPVELISAGTVCAGKYVVLGGGEVDAVQAAVAAGEATAAEKCIDSLVIPRVHEQVPRAVNACTQIDRVDAVGVVELFSVCAAVAAADAAVKAAAVQLIEVRLGRGLGGKSFVVLTGDVSAVRAATEAGRASPDVKGMVSDIVVVASPHPDLVQALL